MTFASFLLSVIFASLYAALFHLWRGGGGKALLFYLGLAWCGFFIAEFLAVWFNRRLYTVGTLDIGFATLGALVFLFAGDWLGRIE